MLKLRTQVFVATAFTATFLMGSAEGQTCDDGAIEETMVKICATYGQAAEDINAETIDQLTRTIWDLHHARRTVARDIDGWGYVSTPEYQDKFYETFGELLRAARLIRHNSDAFWGNNVVVAVGQDSRLTKMSEAYNANQDEFNEFLPDPPAAADPSGLPRSHRRRNYYNTTPVFSRDSCNQSGPLEGNSWLVVDYLAVLTFPTMALARAHVWGVIQRPTRQRSNGGPITPDRCWNEGPQRKLARKERR